MNPLTTADFTAFFQEVWSGLEPFPWQQELLEFVVTNKRWPDLVDIPTGLGKTASIDIALFALAIEATAEPDRRRWVFPHRIVMVVDRRVIVDQAFERARELRKQVLDAAPGSVCARVGQALRTRADVVADDVHGSGPLLASVLRGGIVRDESWARRPEVPAVIASTVDQVGSRLLFRGYGLSTSARPIHAGLLAHDTLYLLDEVHLARPFTETLDAVAGLTRSGESAAVPRRLAVVQLSATPATEVAQRFPTRPLARPTVEPFDLDATTAAGIMARRIGNSKPADLVAVKVPVDPGKANLAFAKAVVKEINQRAPGCSRLAVMVNRVDTARRVAHLLETQASKDGSYEVVLLTGRMRPVDRDRMLDRIGDRLDPGPRESAEAPLVVVATQSLEAGADFDFDVLVTECASLDALRQRFGRVDRDGQRWATGQVTRSAVLCRSTDVAGKAPDPVYGSALTATWAWLQSQNEVDFGFGAMANPEGDDLDALLPPPDRAPLLGRSHLDRWCQTSEREVSAEPDVAQWLHGVDATNELADVQVVWRGGLDPSLFRWYDTAAGSVVPDVGSLAAHIAEALEPVPPLAQEALAVPIREVRRWLRADDTDPLLADAPASGETDDRPWWWDRTERLVARWTGDTAELIPPEQIRPGDTIVVPAEAGGIENGNWNPAASAPVSDESFRLAREVRGIAAVLLTEATCEQHEVAWPDPEALELVPGQERRNRIGALLGEAPAWRDLGALQSRLHMQPVPTRIEPDGRVHADYLVYARIDDRSQPDDLATDATDDALSLIGRAARLDRHLAGVGHHAERFAKALGWDEPLIRSLKLAGELHDAGKADRRFQFVLTGGAPGETLLAKSAERPGDRQSRRVTTRMAGYPAGMRHELLSLALVDELGDVEGVDFDLVKHLVATHHGWGRYRFRPVIDAHPEKAHIEVTASSVGAVALTATTDHGLGAIGSGHDERFWSLNRRYGWWTLAHLEAVLRLADHHRSHLEQLGLVEPEAYMEEGES